MSKRCVISSPRSRKQCRPLQSELRELQWDGDAVQEFSPTAIRFGQGYLKHTNLSFETPLIVRIVPHRLHFTSTSLSTRMPLKKSLSQFLHRYS